jgi:hypothetical protein
MRRRTAISAILSAALIVFALFAPGATLAKSTPNMTKQVKSLIETYGPLIMLHPDEQYVMDKPEAVLDGPSTLVWWLVYDENNPLIFHVDVLGSLGASAETILTDESIALQDPHAGDPNFRYWLESDPSLLSGHMPRAKSYVRVLSQGENAMDLQFWFFYAYNGPVKVRAEIPSDQLSDDFALTQVGRHQGDWEQVTLRFHRDSSTANWMLDQIFLSQHSGGQWLAFDQFEYSGSHPMIYSALDSHANYATAGTQVGQSIPVTDPLQIHQIDYTDAGQAFAAYHPGNFDIVSSDVSGVKTSNPPNWYGYDGLWGPYELHVDSGALGPVELTFPQVDKGPVGPAQH